MVPVRRREVGSESDRRGAREIDRERAAPSRHVAHLDRPVMRLGRLERDGQTQAEPRPILAELYERSEQILHLSRRETAALIGDLDRHPAVSVPGAQDDRRVLVTELQRIVKEVGDRRI